MKGNRVILRYAAFALLLLPALSLSAETFVVTTAADPRPG